MRPLLGRSSSPPRQNRGARAHERARVPATARLHEHVGLVGAVVRAARDVEGAGGPQEAFQLGALLLAGGGVFDRGV